MYIGQTIEFYYVAHILIKNNLSELLIQIDPHLSKGKIDQTLALLISQMYFY
jgi:hypothetical protein